MEEAQLSAAPSFEQTSKDWRSELNEWLKTNPRTIPDELRQLREEFVRRFPKEKIADLTLEQYAFGHDQSRDSLCYWLEFKTRRLGGVGGGSVKKWGVWYSDKDKGWKCNNMYESPEVALSNIKEGLSALIEAVEEKRFDALDEIGVKQLGRHRNSMRGKILSLYFPDEFISISQKKHLEHFLACFGETAQGGALSRNRQLLKVLRSHPEFDALGTHQMTNFLYQRFPPPKEPQGETVNPLPAPIPPKVELSAELQRLMNVTAHTRNVLLYGPPGTGKTYIVRKFVEHFLRPQLQASPSVERQRVAVLQSLKWYEAIALAMTLKDGQDRFKVNELKTDELLSDYAQLKSASKLSNALWAQLQIHTAPDSATVKYTNRSEPFLFDKNENSEWSLTDAGKEYVEANLSEALSRLQNPQEGGIGVEDFCDVVTFHQSFAYEEFVEGLKPLPPEDEEAAGVQYDVVPGVFKSICERAEGAWRAEGKNAPNYLLVIDEINRANIAKVLGELITLIEDDKRIGMENELRVRLPYSGKLFGVPPNLYILGTMNTADRSIALLDLALRRRFTFVEMMPRPSLLKTVAGVDLSELLARLNARISVLLDRDHQIGHSYFLNLNNADDLRFAWYTRVVPLLQEYFYNDSERLRAVIGDSFMRRVSVDEATTRALGELYDDDQPRYEVETLETEDFLAALRQIASA
ncbi:MAG: AAA family ATPase [Pyrinomonadaceae bacterium]